MERSNFKTIGQVIERYLSTEKEARRLCAGLLFGRVSAAWDKAVGVSVAAMTLGKQFRDGVLTVRIGSSVLRMQLQISSESIRRKMNRLLGEDAVKQINLR